MLNREAADIPYRIFRERVQWRDWLARHHADRQEIWLGFYKRGVDKPCVTNNDAVEEALCFGWINGKVHRLDDQLYLQRFTPRHARSVWAPSNKKRVKKLIEAGLMTEFGMQPVRLAKQNGRWDELDTIDPDRLAEDMRLALQANPTAWKNFQQFTDTQRRDYLWWVESAKRSETRTRRIAELVSRCERNLRPGS